MTVIPLGSPVGALITYLQGCPQIEDIIPTPQFSTDMRGWDEAAEGQCWVTIQRTGGASTSEQVLWQREIDLQIDVYGPTMEATESLVDLVLALLFELNQNPVAGAGVSLDWYDVNLLPKWLPDPRTFEPRWSSTGTLGVRPIAVSS